jgi:hypothetical protein
MVKRHWILIVVLILAACANEEYSFERIDGENRIVLPLKFDTLSGVRDGETVRAAVRFRNAGDSAEIDLVLHLGPPAQCTSGTYHVSIDGATRDGPVTCNSLTFLGGQADQPSIGGTFTLNDANGVALYRVTFPNTTMQRLVGI